MADSRVGGDAIVGADRSEGWGLSESVAGSRPGVHGEASPEPAPRHRPEATAGRLTLVAFGPDCWARRAIGPILGQNLGARRVDGLLLAWPAFAS
jgi:hypothetical protein